ncbi:MAG: murein biosynthesis integral membrane protein MurJ [Fimbriimonadaceae bacterium]|nr:MAG: murein biosynthesis integral membrane protein MurJ [Fimbriimonadaceae bacterium]
MAKPSAPQSLTPNIAKAGGIMAASIFLSRILGIVREIIIANRFGQSDFTDAYNYAFQIPDLLFYLIAGGALSSAFIPVFSEYLHTDREDDAWHIFSSVTNIMAIVVTVFIVLAMIFAPVLAGVVAPGLSPEKAETILPMISYMARIVLPAQFAFFIGGILFGTLYSKQIFTVPGLGPNIYNIGIIIGALVLSNFLTLPISGLSWGATIGAFLGNIVVPVIAMRQLNARYSFVIDFKHPGVKKVFKLMAPVVFGLSLPGVFALFLVSISSYFGGDGLASAFKNANQLMQAPLGIFGQSMAIAAFPALAQFFAQGRMDLYREQLVKTLKTIVYLTIPIALILLTSSHQIIQTIFQHNQFTAEDTARTAPLLAAFAIGVPFWCLQPVLMRAYFAIQNTKRPIILGTVTTGIFLILAVSAIFAKLPPFALAAAGSISAIILVSLLTTTITKEIPELSFAPLLETAGKSLIASIGSTIVFWGIFQVVSYIGLGNNKWANVAVMFFFGIISLWVYYFITKALKMPEVAYFQRVAKRINVAKPEEDKPSGPNDQA